MEVSKKLIKYGLLSFLAVKLAYAADPYMVRLNDYPVKPVKQGPNLSGQDGCELNAFGNTLVKDLNIDPLIAKISLKYNARTAEIESLSYGFNLAKKDGKVVYSANKYNEGLFLGPYRFLEITGSQNGKNRANVTVNGHSYVISDIWFSAICLDQNICQKYINMGVGFINPNNNANSVCYIYNKPYIPDKSSNSEVRNKNLRTINQRREKISNDLPL